MLYVVTATTNPYRALPCLRSWGNVPILAVANGCSPLSSKESPDNITWLTNDDYLGTVPAFRQGTDFVLERTQARVICSLHDDVEILQADWVARVLRHFETHPACGLAGFGGAIALGSDDLYTTPYQPMHLARAGFRSNLVDAEVHGVRSLLAEPVACLDGFSQIGRREFWAGWQHPDRTQRKPAAADRPWTFLEDEGVVHHAYDGMLGCLAARYGWETWYLPIRCRHLGGQTAVGDAGYQQWAKDQIPGGDQGFWEQSHKRFAELFRDVLPLRV